MTDTPPDRDGSEAGSHSSPVLDDLGPSGRVRASRISAKKKAEYIDLLREGGRRGKSARSIGVTPRALQLHMRDEEGHLTDFGRLCVEAESEADEEVETALYDAAVSGNVPAIQTWLYNRKSNQWAPKTAAQAVAISGSMSQSVVATIEVSAKEELFAAIQRMGENLSAPTFSPIQAPSSDAAGDQPS